MAQACAHVEVDHRATRTRPTAKGWNRRRLSEGRAVKMREVSVRAVIVGVLCLIVVLQSCGTLTVDPHSIEGKLVARIKTTCGESNGCTIRLRDVTDFDWDRVYVFNYAVTKDQIGKIIGAPFPRYVEFRRSIIFLKGGTVVYSEADPTDIEGPLNDQVVFDIAERGNYRTYSSESRFEVQRKSFSRGVYYELRLIQSPAMN